MEEQWVTLIGLFAAVLTTFAFLPQFLKAWRTKSTKDLSKTTFMIFWAGVLCWLVYGLLIGNFPMIAANAVTILLASGILILKFRHG